MKKKLFIYAVLVCVVCQFSSIQVLGAASQGDADAKIKEAVSYLFQSKRTDIDCKTGLYCLLDATIITSKVSSYPADFKKKLAKANDLLQNHGIFHQEGVKLLHDAYRSINAGQEYRFPDEIKTIESAVEYGKKILNKTREHLQAGNTGKTVKLLLETLIMIVTPIKKH